MHPKIIYPGELAPIIDDLATPLHGRSRRDRQRVPDAATEISLAEGYAMDPSGFAGEEHLDLLLDDLREFMRVVMDAAEAPGGYPIRLTRSPLSDGPENAVERHRITVTDEGCEVAAADLHGLRRAVFRLQDEMLLRRAPILPLGKTTRWTTLGTRIIRSPIAPYRWLSGWELADPHDYYPDEYLKRLSHYGINGLWIPGLLRKLVASETIPEMGPPEHRLDKLKAIIARAARYGIRIYLFCMEPRALPEGHPALAAHPEIVGARTVLGGLQCGSEALVLAYIREVMRTLFTEVPDLAGVINIFCGERPTTCCWREEDARACPRCSQRPQAEVLAETLNAFVDGIRAAGSEAEFMAWSYFVTKHRDTAPITPLLKVMEKADRGVIWVGNFEHGCEKESCGKQVTVHEYSLSCVGPSNDFRDLAREAAKSDHTLYAKLQVGTSYELSSVPHIPVPGLVHEKIRIAGELGVTGSMMTWIPGGFPSPMLRAAGEAAFDPEGAEDGFLRRIAAIEWGENACEDVAEAWRIFAEVWQRYPFDIEILYWGPITRAPAYQLHLEREERLAKPYNWGFTRKRVPQPWEDRLSRWVGPYTPQEIFDAFRAMADQWQAGLAKLKSARVTAGDEPDLDRQLAVASAIRLHFLAAANVYEFYALRDDLREKDRAEHPAMLRHMQDVARDDLRVAREMKDLLAVEPRLGFESEIFDYSYSPALLEEKILQVQDMLPTLARWEQDGIEPEILERTVEEAEWLRPDRDPDRWGD